jgi:hypothetical protein
MRKQKKKTEEQTKTHKFIPDLEKSRKLEIAFKPRKIKPKPCNHNFDIFALTCLNHPK